MYGREHRFVRRTQVFLQRAGGDDRSLSAISACYTTLVHRTLQRRRRHTWRDQPFSEGAASQYASGISSCSPQHFAL